MRIVIADDHELYRSGMLTVLGDEPDIDIVAEVGSLPAAVAKCVDLDPNVVILGHRPPRHSGIEACRAISDRAPRTKSLILTGSGDEGDLVEAMAAGASGYLLKDFPAQQIIESLRLAHRGQALIPLGMSSQLIRELSQPRQTPGESTTPRLSDRELGVLQLVGQGKGNKEIAAQLFISQNTVKNHIQNIRNKLNVGSRIELAMHGAEQEMGDRTGPPR
ncbi:regulatory protein, LuxR:Response regulator receiver [Janibacter sp. HTCC2649]|uniref:LuxR C-terminal-related transcriptional regulator n=1 Tax=Janibacter sp. HTCC2649 TaxID=313589 RepID=UPI0000670FD3|nr:response regulator transcription factor [Janibacter sp. HTCC2649]EAP97288.1 regulatory protein, LuxR:Response regulator receiver [Janibacter sp. HTCC2649]